MESYRDHGHTKVECFSDADWVGSRKDERSTFGYCVFVVGNMVLCKSEHQTSECGFTFKC